MAGKGKLSMAYLDPSRWACSIKIDEPLTIDHVERDLLNYALGKGPDFWAWDPRLAELFDALNERYFGGRVRPHRVFWFHEHQLEQLGVTMPFMHTRISYTSGYRVDWSQFSSSDGVGRYIGIALRLKLMPEVLQRVLRHEMCHDIADEQSHNENFLAALQEQGPGEQWVADQVKSYRARNRASDLIIEAVQKPYLDENGEPRDWREGDVFDPDQDLKSIGRAIARHAITNEELHETIEMLGPLQRFLTLRVVNLDVARAVEGKP